MRDDWIDDDDIWTMCANSVFRPGERTKGTERASLTTLCWNLAGTRMNKLELIVATVGRQYDIDAFLFQESFTARLGDGKNMYT